MWNYVIHITEKYFNGILSMCFFQDNIIGHLMIFNNFNIYQTSVISLTYYQHCLALYYMFVYLSLNVIRCILDRLQHKFYLLLNYQQSNVIN